MPEVMACRGRLYGSSICGFHGMSDRVFEQLQGAVQRIKGGILFLDCYVQIVDFLLYDGDIGLFFFVMLLQGVKKEISFLKRLYLLLQRPDFFVQLCIGFGHGILDRQSAELS
jgi:hypothetical protein